MSDDSVSFSVITATYNAEAVLPRLIRSLRAQTDQDFEWVVADGASSDGTLDLLEDACRVLNVHMDSRPDFGIYDALNRAVKMATGEYYLVLGADDTLFPDAIKKYKSLCRVTHADLITAPYQFNGKVRTVANYRWEWLNGWFAYVSGHSVGLAIRRTLHERFGFYINKLPITADRVFVLNAVHNGATISEGSFLAGELSSKGLSHTDRLGAKVEAFRAQLLAGHNLVVQLILLNYRLLLKPLFRSKQ